MKRNDMVLTFPIDDLSDDSLLANELVRMSLC